MKDFIEKWLAYIPAYLEDLGSLLSGPKRFIAQKDVGPEFPLEEPLRFLAVSLAILIVIRTIVDASGGDIWRTAAATAIPYALHIAAIAVAARAAWRMVGGTAPVRSFVAVYAYYVGAAAVIFVVIDLMGLGVLRVFDPGLYERWLEFRRESAIMAPPDLGTMMLESRAGIAYLAVTQVGSAIIVAWSIIGWGAFRRINGVSRRASLVAWFLTYLFAVPLLVGVMFIDRALVGL